MTPNPKKERVLQIAKDHPDLNRAEIARMANCSAAFVTQTLGTVRQYKKREKPQEQPS
jgi:hypothetical protein